MASNESYNQTNQHCPHNHIPGPSGDDKGPRQPKADTENKLLGSRLVNVLDKRNKDQADLQLKQQQAGMQLPVITKLSVDAPEFVPRAKQQQFSGLSQEAPAFYPSGAGAAPYINPNQGYEAEAYDPTAYVENSFVHLSLQEGYAATGGWESTGDPFFDKFIETLSILTQHPGNMEEYLRSIVDMVNSGQAAKTDVGAIVDHLFDLSLREPNFRYTGARVCQYLNINLKSSPQFSEFHKKFIKRCNLEFNKKDELLKGSEEDQELLRGLVLLMAEIFLNVEVETSQGMQRLSFLPRILVDLAECLLSLPSDMNIKCVCQLFKLSGALIEDIVKEAPADCIKFEEVFSRMQTLLKDHTVTSDAKFRIRNLITQKEANWERNFSSPPKQHPYSTNSNVFQGQEPVFYNSQGQECSREEAGLPDDDYDESVHILNEEEEEALRLFEEEQEQSRHYGGGLSSDSDSNSFADDGGEMGAEMEAAFEEYLQHQQNYIYNRHQHIQEPAHRRHHQQQPPQIPNSYYHQPPPQDHYSSMQQQHYQNYSQDMYHYQAPGLPQQQHHMYNTMQQQYPTRYNSHTSMPPPPPQHQQQQAQQYFPSQQMPPQHQYQQYPHQQPPSQK